MTDGERAAARIARRRVLVGGGAVVVTAVAGAAATRSSVLRRAFDRLTRDCGEPGPIPPTSPARSTDGTFASSVLGRDVGYALATPPGHVPGAPLPVAFMLPGRGGTARSNLDGTRMADFVAQGIAERGLPPFALAAVDGGESYWHARAGGEDRMAMLTREFVPMCAERWRLGDGTGRAVIGWSMGGYGALLAGQEHPDLFSAVAAASPAVWRSFDEMSHAVGDAFDSAQDYAAHDLFVHHDRLQELRVRIDCGTGDPFYPNVRALVAALDPPPEGTFFEGCHDSDSWRVVAAAQTDFLAAALRG